MIEKNTHTLTQALWNQRVRKLALLLHTLSFIHCLQQYVMMI